MEFPKKKRIQNQDLIDYLKERLECACCNSPPPVDMDHLTTRGAGGSDTFDNLVPLCRTVSSSCHNLRHAKGIAYLAERFPSYRAYLRMIGRFDEITKAKEKLKSK